MTSERSEISLHEVKLYRALKASPDRWFTSIELADICNIAKRTARQHGSRFVKLGIVDMAEVFPAHRYRYSQKAERRNIAYLQRLDQADKVFNGIGLGAARKGA